MPKITNKKTKVSLTHPTKKEEVVKSQTKKGKEKVTTTATGKAKKTLKLIRKRK